MTGQARTHLAIEAFRHPDPQFLPSVMWFWNDRLSDAEITYQIARFAEAGLREFFVHPLWGLEEDYLSDRYFDRIRHAVAVAKAHGMRFWIYDEYNWPSGNAGGKLLKEEPWTRSKVLKSMKVDLFAGQPMRVQFRGDFISAQVMYANKQPIIEDISGQVALTQHGEWTELTFANDGCAGCTVWISYTDITRGLMTTGMWSSFSWFQEGYLDTHDAEAVGRFIAYTHERYKAAIGSEFGRTVKGIFTDEVNNMSMFDNEPGVTPWTRTLMEEFRKDHGYDLLPNLYALNCTQLTPEVLKVRFDYWRTCTRLFRNAYMQQVADWCAANGLLLTGHPSGENSLYWHMFQMGDFFEAVTPMHIPGIDSILSKQSVDDPGFSIEAKLAASAAKFNCRPRVMCETYSGSGWDMTMAEAKRIANRLMVHGINMIVYMGAYYSLNGGRKKLPLGYPPSHGYNNPLFAHYGLLNEHIARVCALSAATQPAGRVLVMLPQVTQYIEPYESAKHDLAWHSAAIALMELQIEFDFGFECLAGEMQVRDGKLLLRGCEYDAVLVPGMKYTTRQMADVLASFTLDGGRTVWIGEAPQQAVDTGERLEQLTALIRSGAIGLIETRGLSRAEATVKVKESLAAAGFTASAPIRIEARPGIYSGYRTGDGFHLLLVANDNAETTIVEGELAGDSRLLVLNPSTGESEETALHHEDGKRRFAVSLPGYHMAVLLPVSDAGSEAPRAVPADGAHDLAAYPLDGDWTFTAEGGNWLPLRLKFVRDVERVLALVREGRTDDLLAYLREVEQSADGIYAAGELPGGTGIGFGAPYAAVASFVVEEIPAMLDLIAELEADTAVYLNGCRLDGFAPIRLWGIREAQRPAANLVKPGRNTLLLIDKVPLWRGPHAMPSILLRGGFALDAEDRLVKPAARIKPYYWSSQGYPYFSGRGVYRKTFEWKRDGVGGGSIMKLQIPTHDSAEVVLNGRRMAVLPWAPYEVDLNGACIDGINELELIITNGYANLMDVEKVRLLSQGVTVYEDGARIESGLAGPPVILTNK
jgi:hypothetical protein